MPKATAELVRRMLRDTTKVERLGVQAAAVIGLRARKAAVTALRRGTDPVMATRAQLGRAVPLLTEAMVVSHLQGRRRGAITAGSALGRKVKLGVFDETLNYLAKLADATPEELARLRTQYGQQALKLVEGIEDQAQRSILAELSDLVAEGRAGREAYKALGKAFESAGLTPDNSFTLETVFRTQSQMAYSAGRWNTLRQPGVWDELWGFEYSTVADDRVRPEHAMLEGTRLPKDHAFWQTSFPPNGFNCRCTAIEVFNDDPQASEVQPLDEMEIDGRIIKGGADKGFAFNPGEVFRDQ